MDENQQEEETEKEDCDDVSMMREVASRPEIDLNTFIAPFYRVADFIPDLCNFRGQIMDGEEFLWFFDHNLRALIYLLDADEVPYSLPALVELWKDLEGMPEMSHYLMHYFYARTIFDESERIFNVIRDEEDAEIAEEVVRYGEPRRLYFCLNYAFYMKPDYCHKDAEDMGCLRTYYETEMALMHHVKEHHMSKLLRRNENKRFRRRTQPSFPPYSPENLLYVRFDRVEKNIPKDLDEWMTQNDKILQCNISPLFLRNYDILEFFPAYHAYYLCGCGLSLDSEHFNNL